MLSEREMAEIIVSHVRIDHTGVYVHAGDGAHAIAERLGEGVVFDRIAKALDFDGGQPERGIQLEFGGFAWYLYGDECEDIVGDGRDYRVYIVKENSDLTTP